MGIWYEQGTLPEEPEIEQPGGPKELREAYVENYEAAIRRRESAKKRLGEYCKGGKLKWEK